ncbi:hypothetical protein HIM_05549 [Hirsutella minnesotensis 3608]|uniref:D-xylose 1-dehydrogenase (NADP(+), D-xylono-1,5-lactone-forming) n=1 Tax=Hirsutella minnesotensis 3608 TaxID=1043627 RepID=A0A0F7ZUL3_9HYPO|nr:hypothetical protein HIM_05549 [Hirsutella minnesotensis 3608]
MAPSEPYTLKWGIMATVFCKDLLTDPATREVHDVRHEIAAVSSSTSADKARDFVKRIDGPSTIKTYGSYAELVADPNVDIVYVATPHSHHFQNAMLALQAGKNVLCEKALTVTTSQARKLVETAKSKNLFFMEAVWTRYFPLSIKIREMIAAGEIGTVYRTFADLSFNECSEKDDKVIGLKESNRLINMDLAGGALLDLGVYSLTWVFQTLYHEQPESEYEKERPIVLSAVNQYTTGADELTSIICHFPKHRSMGIATTSLRVATDPNDSKSAPAIRIQGSKGEIQVAHPAYRPTEFKVLRRGAEGKAEVVECPIPRDPKRDWGHGMFWEADECARCLRDGKRQSDTMPWSESLAIMETMESTLQQGGVKYPALITADVFDAKSPLNTGSQ